MDIVQRFNRCFSRYSSDFKDFLYLAQEKTPQINVISLNYKNALFSLDECEDEQFEKLMKFFSEPLEISNGDADIKIGETMFYFGVLEIDYVKNKPALDKILEINIEFIDLNTIDRLLINVNNIKKMNGTLTPKGWRISLYFKESVRMIHEIQLLSNDQKNQLDMFMENNERYLCIDIKQNYRS